MTPISSMSLEVIGRSRGESTNLSDNSEGVVLERHPSNGHRVLAQEPRYVGTVDI